MAKMRWIPVFWLFLFGLVLAGCGPDTIFVRPGLDTPAQHAANGYQLLERGKLEDACREFNRAKMLDPNFVKAYVGLGVAMARKGDIPAGLALLGQAEQMASSAEEISDVRYGYQQLDEIKNSQME